MTAIDKNKVIDFHQSNFGTPEIILQVPGRANIIGEHTDYNQGFVMPFCLNKYIWFALSLNHEDDNINIHAVQHSDFFKADNNYTAANWQFFIKNLLNICERKGLPIKPISISFGGDLPIGAGMSSSSALVCGMISLFDRINHWGMSNIDKVKMASLVEHGAGVRGGLMDQFTIFHGKAGYAIKLDCNDLSFEYIPIPSDWNFFLIDSVVAHLLAFTAFNQRRNTCEAALEKMKKSKNISYLCEWPLIETGELSQILTEDEYTKVSFVLHENNRVSQMQEAMLSSDIILAGKLMVDSHNGLSKEYKVSIPELDYIVKVALKNHSIVGSRMMGGGFGGCTIQLSNKCISDLEAEEIIKQYDIQYKASSKYYYIESVNGIANAEY